MLKRWTIENFKSFRDRTDIPLAPINIFAGANSSGKSTIIQSILMLKQTLQYAPSNRAIALNGPLLKLGTFSDIKNKNGKQPYIGIAFTLDTDSQRSRPRSPARFDLGQQPLFSYYSGSGELKTVESEIHFDISQPAHSHHTEYRGTSTAEELRQLQPGLRSSSISALLGHDEQTQHKVRLALLRSSENFPSKEERLAIAVTPADFVQALIDYDVAKIDNQTRDGLLDSKPDSKIIGANVRHFLPFQIGIRFDQEKERARRIAELICKDAISYHPNNAELLNAIVPPAVLTLIQESLHEWEVPNVSERDLFGNQTELSVRRLRERLRYLIQPRRSIGRTSALVRMSTLPIGDLQSAIEKLLTNEFPSKMDVEVKFPRDVAVPIEYLRAYFAYGVRYLGPLRDEPKPIYPLEALANPTEVGYKGEHTAAVLDLNRDLPIEYIPSAFARDVSARREGAIATLHDAVVDWLSYFGIAEDVSTGDRGKIGHQLQVRTKGLTQLHDLTNVGVGVSQVLPIIVMALLAEAPCLLIFEQPELHLHPRVQARLADFFLSVGLLGKQCVLETHSEYLVERFRRRIAEASGDSLAGVLKLYFTERKGGDTTCRSVDVSRYGAIADYPKDFFDQSEEETEAILQAARLKRASERA